MKRWKDAGIAALGVALVVAGLCLLKYGAISQTVQALPYVCIGIGCGLFGQGMGEFIAGRALKSCPEAAQRLRIEKNDERNLALTYRAKGKAFDRMTFVFGALMVSFALMAVEWTAVILLVLAYLYVHGCALYYRARLEKEM